MTAIVGVVEQGTVWMGGDSAGVDDRYGLQICRTAKVFTNGPFILGYTSSFRQGQLLQHAFVPPEQPPSYSIEKFMAVTFIDAVRNYLKTGGYAKRENE